MGLYIIYALQNFSTTKRLNPKITAFILVHNQ